MLPGGIPNSVKPSVSAGIPLPRGIPSALARSGYLSGCLKNAIFDGGGFGTDSFTIFPPKKVKSQRLFVDFDY